MDGYRKLTLDLPIIHKVLFFTLPKELQHLLNFYLKREGTLQHLGDNIETLFQELFNTDQRGHRIPRE
jgi:hypothetical protein